MRAGIPGKWWRAKVGTEETRVGYESGLREAGCLTARCLSHPFATGRRLEPQGKAKAAQTRIVVVFCAVFTKMTSTRRIRGDYLMTQCRIVGHS